MASAAPSNAGSSDPPADPPADQAAAQAPAQPITTRSAVNLVAADKPAALIVERSQPQPGADPVITLATPMLAAEPAETPRPSLSQARASALPAASETAAKSRATPPGQNSGSDAPLALAPPESGLKSSAAAVETAPPLAPAEHNLTAHSTDHLTIASNPSSSHSPAAQVSSTILRFSSDKSGEQRLSVRLTPEDLGKVEISLSRAKSGVTSVSISAERAGTLALLTNDQSTLERALDHAGVAAEGRSFSFSLMDQDRRPSSQSFARAKQSAPPVVTSSPDSQVTRIGLVNITA